MRIIVCGGRDYKDRTRVFDVLDALRHNLSNLSQGGADGADSLAAEWALDRCVPFTTYPANWRLYGKSAGPRRNSLMLSRALAASEHEEVRVVAFPGGRGTADMVSKARAHGLTVHEVSA